VKRKQYVQFDDPTLKDHWKILAKHLEDCFQLVAKDDEVIAEAMLACFKCCINKALYEGDPFVPQLFARLLMCAIGDTFKELEQKEVVE